MKKMSCTPKKQIAHQRKQLHTKKKAAFFGVLELAHQNPQGLWCAICTT
jgi:hypothetical protein